MKKGDVIGQTHEVCSKLCMSECLAISVSVLLTQLILNSSSKHFALDL